MPDPLIVKFDGGLAHEHMFPLYHGGESLSGIGLAFTRISHYMITGEVKHRAPYDSRLQIITRPPRQGSIEFDFIGYLAGPAPTTMIGQVTLSVGAGLILSTGIYLFNKLVGRSVETPDELKELEEQRPGDIDALSSAILPNLKRTHSIINHGAGSISITGNNNTAILDNSTKDYINISVQDNDDVWIDGSIGWINANQRTGGAFVYEHGRVIPFDMKKDITINSLQVISKSQSEYLIGNKENSRISLKVIPTKTVDGKLKRYLLLEASEISDDIDDLF